MKDYLSFSWLMMFWTLHLHRTNRKVLPSNLLDLCPHAETPFTSIHLCRFVDQPQLADHRVWVVIMDNGWSGNREYLRISVPTPKPWSIWMEPWSVLNAAIHGSRCNPTCWILEWSRRKPTPWLAEYRLPIIVTGEFFSTTSKQSVETILWVVVRLACG